MSPIFLAKPTMSKAFLPALAVTGALAAGALPARADMEEIRESGTMTVATEDDYAPFNFIVDGQPEGFHAELMEDLRAYAAEEDIEVQQEILPWTGLLASVSSGQYDVAFTGALVTDDRLRVLNYAPPFASAQHYYVKRAGDDRLGGVDTLCGLTVGLQAGSALLARLPELQEMMGDDCALGEVVEYQSYPEAYADLANGRLDYVINALISINDLTSSRGDTFERGVAVSGPGFAGWPISKQSPELLEYMTGFMQEIRDNGRLAELQEKWFGEAFPDLPTEPITEVEQFHTLAGLN